MLHYAHKLIVVFRVFICLWKRRAAWLRLLGVFQFRPRYLASFFPCPYPLPSFSWAAWPVPCVPMQAACTRGLLGRSRRPSTSSKGSQPLRSFIETHSQMQ